MQGQRSTIGPLPETLDFDCGSTSSDAGVDQQILWNDMRNPTQIQLSDYMLSPSQEGPNISGWSLGEPSSSAVQNQAIHNEGKTEIGWLSSGTASVGAVPMSEDRRYESANNLSLNNVNVSVRRNQIRNGPSFMHGSSSDSFPRDLNIVGHSVDDSQVIECPIAYTSEGSENVQISTAISSSDPFGVLAPGNGGYLEENDGRPGCSLEGRRLSCKRKVLEGNVGQSSGSGSSNYFQPAEGSAWHSVPAHFNASGSLSISTQTENSPGVSPSEQVNPRLGLGFGRVASESPLALTTPGNAESSRRNFRLRINASHQQDFIPTNVFPTGNALGHSNGSSAHHSSRFVPLNNNLDWRSAPALSVDTNPQTLSGGARVPSLRRISHASRWGGGSSSSRAGGSSSYVISGERDAAPPEESNSRSIPRNISEHPMFLPATELRNLAQNPPNVNLTGGNISIAGNVASTSRTGSSSGVHSSASPNWIPHRNPPQYQRRLSEFVRRSMFSGSESGGQSSNHSRLRSGRSASSQEMPLSSGAGTGHHLSHPRSALLMERQLDGAIGIPYSLQTLAAASEGRSRLASEIRNVLDLMRRGEGLRYEDVMILDQSVFFGMTDIQDQHRDMRLDVDNMSYEELLALEERIGNVNTGLTEETISNRLKQRKCSSNTAGQQDVEPCCVCQEEYNDGEDLGTLDCGHDFHKECIKQWLLLKNLCPICKMTGLLK